MKKKLILLAGLAIIALTGCQTCREQAWTPDSFNYTLQRDRMTGDVSDYFGLSWNLKPDKK